jgi:hypothetical protein
VSVVVMPESEVPMSEVRMAMMPMTVMPVVPVVPMIRSGVAAKVCADCCGGNQAGQ